MDELYTQFDGTFFERTRLSILTVIYRVGPVSFNFLRGQLGANDGAIYMHVEKLVRDGYLKKRRRIADGSPQTTYYLTRRGGEVFQDYLSFIEQVLGTRTSHE